MPSPVHVGAPSFCRVFTPRRRHRWRPLSVVVMDDWKKSSPPTALLQPSASPGQDHVPPIQTQGPIVLMSATVLMAPGIGTDCMGSWSESLRRSGELHPLHDDAPLRSGQCLRPTVPHRACQILEHLQTHIGPAFPFKLSQVNPTMRKRGIDGRGLGQHRFFSPDGPDPDKFGPSKTTHRQSLGSSQWPCSPVPTPSPVPESGTPPRAVIVGFARGPAGILGGANTPIVLAPLGRVPKPFPTTQGSALTSLRSPSKGPTSDDGFVQLPAKARTSFCSPTPMVTSTTTFLKHASAMR